MAELLSEKMKEVIKTWSARIAAAFALLFLVYVFTAPPIMTSIARTQGSLSFPAVYQPFIDVIESDFGGPLRWYFNDVWGSEIILIGEDTTPPPYVILCYAAFGVLLLSALAFPFLRRQRCKTPPSKLKSPT